MEVIHYVVLQMYYKKERYKKMIVTDYNKMTLSELESVSKKAGIGFVIKAGKIVGAEKEEKINGKKKNRR